MGVERFRSYFVEFPSLLFLAKIFLSFCLFLSLATSRAQTSRVSSRVDFKADTYKSNLDTGETEASGNVKIQIGVQTIFCDVVRMNNKTGLAKASGNVRYLKEKLTIKSDKADFDMTTGYGVFYDAILTVENEFYLEARTLKRTEDRTYLALHGKMSSCLDCPKSWSFVGASIEIELENFAKINHGFAQILDFPIFYFPYFLFPIKTVRQTGLLVPKFSFRSELGFTIKQPYFWAPAPNWDITTDYRYMSEGGHGGGVDFRLTSGDRSFYEIKSSYARNLGVLQVPQNRGAFVVAAKEQITPQWTARLGSEISSDTRYSRHFKDEFLYADRPTLETKPQINWQNENQWFETSMSLHLDNLPRDSERENAIHQVPAISYVVPSLSVWNTLRSTVEVDSVKFLRKGLGYDAGTQWIREGERHSLVARWNLPVDLGSWLQYHFKAETRGDAYRFSDILPTDRNSAFRVRNQMEQEINTEIYKVYSVNNDSTLKAIKHSWIPLVRWSYSPPDAKTDHRFFAADNSPRFDLFDPNSPEISTSALGLLPEEKRFRSHHLLTLGLLTRVVGRYGETHKRYEEFFSASLEQDFSIKNDELDRPAKISANLTLDNLVLSTSINLQLFGDNRGQGYFVNNLKYSKWLLVFDLGQTILPDREIYSTKVLLNKWGPWSFSVAGNYDGLTRTLYSRSLALAYESPSKCWSTEIAFLEEWNTKASRYTWGVIPTIQIFFDRSGRSIGNAK
jgi:lipopolysaccharide assembly outer membrane protein LptD (OstA)